MAIIGTLTSNIWLFRAFFGERVIDIWWDDLLSAASNGKSLGLLLLYGVLNYIFVVQFDVLRAYAILGFVVAFVLLLPEKRQWIFIGVALTAHITLMLMPLFTADGTFMLPGLVFPGDAAIRAANRGTGRRCRRTH